jgi:photosystem II stability/assembly factor-like uncharacterized protein
MENQMKTKILYIIALYFLVITSVVSAQWFPVNSGTTNNLYGAYLLPSGVGYVVGDMGTILKTTDSGNSWNPLTSGTTSGLNNVYFFDDNTGIVVGDGGLILRTTNGGSSWNTIVVTDIYDRLLSVSFSGVYGVIGGESQTIIYSTNSGVSWLLGQTGFFGGGFWGAQMLNSTTAFVAGQNSISAPLTGKSTDGGANWNFNTFYFQSNEGRCEDVHYFNASTGIVSGSTWIGGGAISRTTDGGSNWTTTLFTNVLEGMDFPMASTGYAVGWSGSIIYTTDSGNTWTEQTTSSSYYFSDIAFVPNTLTGVVVGTSGTMLRTENGGLPVELVSFTASVNNNDVTLNWSTATELNNRGFEIERKVGENEFEQIGFVPGFGTTTETKNYQFKDANLNSGTYTYRLKQVDFDGTFEYSNEINVDVTNPFQFELSQNYPNPFNPSTTIQFSIANSEMVNIAIYNELGEKVSELVNSVLSSGNHSVQFDAMGLASGIYIVKMRAGEFSKTIKMNLLK